MAERLLSYRDVKRETTLSESTIRRLIAEGRFPRPRPLLPGRVVWTEAEVSSAVGRLLAMARANGPETA